MGGNFLFQGTSISVPFTEYYELNVLTGGPAHVHIQEGDCFDGYDLNLVILLIRGEALVVFPYLCGELEVLVSHCLIHHMLKLF